MVDLHQRDGRYDGRQQEEESAFLGSGYIIIFGQIVPMRVKELSDTNLVASNLSKSQKAYTSR